MARVKNNSNKWAYLNEKGDFITPFKYDSCRDLNAGWASVAIKTEQELGWMGPGFYLQFGSIDKNGEQILPFKYAHLGFLSEGIVDYSPKKNIGNYYDDRNLFDNKITKGFIHFNDTKLTDVTFDIVYPYSEGLSLVANRDSGNGLSWYMYSYIDKEGNLIRDFDFESAEIFSSGFAVIKMPGNTNSGNQNYIDKSGNIVFDSHLKKTKHSLWVLILLKQKIKQ